jgi:MSHA biogenesis protein MshO
MRPMRPVPAVRPGPRPGFTLIEVIVAIVIFAALGATTAVFYRPAVESFLGLRTRAALVDEADGALRLMLRDVRSAVPNSIRSPDTSCFELVPTRTGGRYRAGPDIAHPGDGALWLDTSTTTTEFDVLGPLSATPQVNDWLVVDNQNPDDVYSGSNRSVIRQVSTPPASAGTLRLRVDTQQFPLGYDGGRFSVVPASEGAVFYVCAGASSTLDGRGDAPGVLYRLKNYGFNASAPNACPSTTGAAVVTRQVSACRFVYTANQAATQQSGFISVQIELTRANTRASLTMGAHVMNVP